MNDAKQHPVFETLMCFFSACSLIGSVLAVWFLEVMEREGPEFNPHELVAMFIVLAQLILFIISLISGVVLAGFYGGLRLRKTTVVLIILAVCGLVVQFFLFKT